ncbi:hypothetical protein D3C87_1617610 [compost metagenome]
MDETGDLSVGRDDRAIGIEMREVDGIELERFNRDIYVSKGWNDGSQPWCQPSGRKTAFRQNLHLPPAAGGHEIGKTADHSLESVRKAGVKRAAGLGQHQFAALAAEECLPEMGFQNAHLLADCGSRDMQFFRRPREAGVTRGHDKCAQGRQRRQPGKRRQPESRSCDRRRDEFRSHGRFPFIARTPGLP